MLNRLEEAQSKWGGANKVIDAWLQERSDVLKAYCNLAGLPPYDYADRALPNPTNIQRFCQILMDYISAGHFEIYDQIVSQCAQNGPESLALARKVYPKINASTDVALAFNDQFADSTLAPSLNGFDDVLSNLGQVLEERFELEDQLIDALYHKHSN